MKKETSIAAPIIWAVFTMLWIIILCLRIQLENNESLLVLTGLCIIMGVINTAIHWQRYKRSKECANDTPAGNDSI